MQRLFPDRVWTFTSLNTVYLTFDDGPIPEVTPWVLDLLKQHDAKATFFCIGDNIRKHPEIFKRIISEGHSFGNHTYNHLNGWKTNTKPYLENMRQCEEVMAELSDANASEVGSKKNENSQITNFNSSIENHQSKNTNLFRPPYGKMTSSQAKSLQKKGYKIIMWDVLSEDYDVSISEEKCLKNVISNIEPGSIVVFHDSLKAEKNLWHTLPKVLQYIADKNWSCSSIESSEII